MNLTRIVSVLMALNGFASFAAHADGAGFRKVVSLAPTADLAAHLREALAQAQPGTLIELPEGKFDFDDEIIVDQSHITLRGQGQRKTILSFKKQGAGAQGILGTQPELTLENFAVEDTPGDSIKVAGGDGITFRGLRVEWTRGPNSKNGGYGLYPVSSRNILIEDCEVAGASDSGIYVGQSENIIVRRNNVYHNVAGIEIENSRYADVTNNVSHHNAAGILIFDLPELPKQGGRQTRVFSNYVHDNNHVNFSVAGNILHIVPRGSGILVIANNDDEIFGNRIDCHKLVSIGVINFQASQHPFNDPNYNPRPEKIFIHDNRIWQHRYSFFDGSQMNTIANLLFGLRVPEIVYDGIDDGTYNGTPLSADRRICLKNNFSRRRGGPATFGNMHLDHQRKLVPWPGGPVDRSYGAHDCELTPLPAVVLDPPHPLPDPVTPVPTEVVNLLCQTSGTGVNWAALEVNCSKLSDYRLFANSMDPTSGPQSGGMPYDLTAPLFSDYAAKDRFVFLPPGASANYQSDGTLDFPVGTIISKTFSFYKNIDDPTQGRQLVETRLLVHRSEGWAAIPYLWSDDQSEATLNLGGVVKTIEWKTHDPHVSRTIQYGVPGVAKCVFCHSATGNLGPIGPKAKFLNKTFAYAEGAENQLTHWQHQGILSGLPEDVSSWPRVPVWSDPKDGTLEQRAKGYLEINCAHCHNPTGLARNTGFYLEYERDVNSTAYGMCKPPVAAGQGSGGRLDDIVPGRPAQSILTYRLGSDQPSIRMPEEGRGVVHAEGLKLIEDWIASRAYKRCE